VFLIGPILMAARQFPTGTTSQSSTAATTTISSCTDPASLRP